MIIALLIFLGQSVELSKPEALMRIFSQNTGLSVTDPSRISGAIAPIEGENDETVLIVVSTKPQIFFGTLCKGIQIEFTALKRGEDIEDINLSHREFFKQAISGDCSSGDRWISVHPFQSNSPGYIARLIQETPTVLRRVKLSDCSTNLSDSDCASLIASLDKSKNTPLRGVFSMVKSSTPSDAQYKLSADLNDNSYVNFTARLERATGTLEIVEFLEFGTESFRLSSTKPLKN